MKSDHCMKLLVSMNRCMHHNHRLTVAHSAQRQFFILIGVVVLLCILLELRLWPLLPQNIGNPQPVRPRLFITCECNYKQRLGNTMFSFAAAIGIASLNNMTSIVEQSCPLVDTFDLSEPISINMDNTMGYSSVNYEEYGHRGSAYDRATRNLSKVVSRWPSHVRLLGYFQSWRYFHNVANRVRQNFVFHQHISTKAEAFLSSVKPAAWIQSEINFVHVGVHVRRGDMINPRFRDYGYLVATPHYFWSAMQYFAQRYIRVQFIVCSDTMEWSRNNLPPAAEIGSNVDVIFSDSDSPQVDLAILASCDHVIMSVGSFGWWAAWLANGTTIYYADWPRPFSKLEYHVNKDDYFPKHWIPLR